MRLKEAFDYVKKERKIIKPNKKFVEDLLNLELKIYGNNSCEGNYIN